MAKTRPTGRPRPLLSDEAADYIRELITSGQLTEGVSVRPEQVAADLGISTTPAREGLMLLQTEGFVRLERRRGFVVEALSRQDVQDAFEAQALLAGELVARATVLATETDIEAIEGMQTLLNQAVDTGNVQAAEAINFDLHRALYRLGGSPKLRHLLRLAVKYAPRRFYGTIGGWPEASISGHEALIDALRRRDPEAARAAMAEHIREAGVLLSNHLERAGDETLPSPGA